MPVLKLDKRCKWCQAVKADKKLLKRIYASAFYVENGESIKNIAATYVGGGIYPALLNHCKRHQGLTDDDLNTREVQRIAKSTSNAMIAQGVKTATARQGIIDNLSDVLTGDDYASLSPEDKIKLLLKAIKDTDDVDAKRKDQDIDVFRMMGGIRSGEIKPVIEGTVVADEPYDPWSAEATGADNEGA